MLRSARKIARKYALKRRAESQDETRRKIVEAAVGLHTTVGPANTTDVAIAERAGVTRRTFYRHFPPAAGCVATVDELFSERCLCSGH
jgi:AcrR family transcriptional regulator